MSKRAVIYARVSTDKQRDNYSIPLQVAECKKYIESKGYQVVGNRYVDHLTGRDIKNAPGAILAYVDDISSSETERPAFDAALDYCDNYGFDVMIIYIFDRFARDPYIARVLENELEAREVKIEFVSGGYEESPEGDIRKGFDALMAKYENARRAKRSKEGKLEKAQRGLFVAGRAPFGYQIDKTAPGGLTIIEAQAAVIRRIFETYVTSNLSIYGVVDSLNKSGILPYMGKIWQKSSVHRILCNEMYNGIGYYNKNIRKKKVLTQRDSTEWIQFSTPAIIEKGLFDEAQKRLHHNRETLRKQTKRDYLLSGIVLCETCNKPYISQTATAGKNGRLNDASFYRHRIRQGHCNNHTISARKLEPIIWDKIITLLLDPGSLQEGYTQALEKEKETHKRQYELRDRINSDIIKLDQRQANLTRLYTDPDITMDKTEYMEQRTRIQNDQKNAKARLQEVEEQLSDIPTPQEYTSLETFAAELKERLTGTDWKPTPANMRKVLELLHIQIMIGSEGQGRIIGWFGAPVGFMYMKSALHGQKAYGYFSIPFEII